jgi:hypothetical protein
MRPPRRALAQITSKEARDPLNWRLGAFGAKLKADATVAPTTTVYIIFFMETSNKQGKQKMMIFITANKKRHLSHAIDDAGIRL